MTDDRQKNIINQLHPRKIILPVVIGLIVVLWLLVKDVNINVLKEIVFSWKSVFWLFVALLLIIIRTFGYMARLRVLTGNDLSWIQSFRIIMLWEFTSAITPSTVGGTGFAIIFLHKEGINVGRSTAVVLATSFLDELYFVIMLPLLLLLVGGRSLFITSLHGTGIALLNNLVLVAIIGYTIIFLWVVLVGYGLFINPAGIKNLIITIFRLPFLKRWKDSAIKAGNDLIDSSNELRHESFSFWFKATVSTFLTWTSRYWVVNAILLAFFTIKDHLLIFARQLVLWIMMIISPTPGGSGFAEIILGRYISDLIPADPVHVGGVALAMALIWRMISYYPFLIAGAIIVPGWIDRKFVEPFTKKQ
ncbi:MAG: flippase-like domain-containing protein [Bacteroidales bacterium]|nr:flippase-like domain-containing protein [Bacteroidales bacterium]